MPKQKMKWESTYKPGELNALRDSRSEEYNRREQKADPEVNHNHLAPQNLDPNKTKEVQKTLRKRAGY